MKQENLKFLQDNYHHWQTLRDAQYLKGLNGHEREGMERVMSEEFQPGYKTDLWCPPCVVEMVTRLYRHYEAWLSAQPKEEPELKVKANFPSHKNHKRRG